MACSAGGQRRGTINIESFEQERILIMISVCRIVLLLLLFPAFASAGIIRSTAGGGNWSNTATWETEVVPGVGDMAEILGPVTVDIDITVGASANSGNLTAIQIMNGSSLTIGSGKTLTSRGDIWVSNAVVTLKAGAILEFDGSVNGSQYQFYFAQAGGRLQINGTSGARCKIFSNVNGPNAWIYANDKGSISASYCDFLRMGKGDSGLASLWWSPVDDTEITLYHCTFSSCSFVYISHPTAKSVVDVQDCIWTSSTMDKCARIDAKTVKTGGLRRFVRCWFDTNFAFGASQGVTLEGNVFYGGIWNAGYGSRWALFDSNLVRLQGTDGKTSIIGDGDMNNIYFLYDGEGTPVSNPHYCNISRSLPGEFMIKNCIFECPFYDKNSDTGDSILIEGGSTVQLVTMQQCIGLPVNPIYVGSDNNSSGTAFTIFSSSSGIDFRFNKNTFYGGLPRGICMMGEGRIPFYGKVSSFKDNLFWDNIEAGSERAFAINTSATDVVDRFLPDGATNNGWWRLRKTESQSSMSSQGTIYNVPTTGTVPGANDINADPQFIDPTRNFASWAVMQGSPSATKTGQIMDGLSYLMVDLSLLTKSSTGLFAWVRSGFAPTNPAFIGKASDGTTIGAVLYGSVFVNKDDPTCGGNKPCCESIQAGIDTASTGYLIKIAEGFYSESITLNTPKYLTIQGGWNSSFTSQTPNRTIMQSPTVPQGSLTIQMVTIKP